MRLHLLVSAPAIALATLGPTSSAHSQASESQALVAAVRLGRPAEVRALLAQGADPNIRVDDGPGSGGNLVSVAFTTINGMALLNRLDRPDPARHAAALEVLRALVERKANLDLAFRIGPRNGDRVAHRGEVTSVLSFRAERGIFIIPVESPLSGG